jgi:RHS repeat-associated protein
MTSVTDWNSHETSFAWTADGQLATQTDPNGVSESRTYDSVGRTTQIQTATSAATLATFGYSYDNAGQLVADTTTDPVVTSLAHSYTYDPLNQLASSTTGSVTSDYEATSAGLLTGTAGATQTFNSAQELTAVTPATGPATSLTYDGNGSRVSSTIAATETTAAATTSYSYAPNGSLASVVLPTSTPSTISYISDGDGLRQTRTSSTGTTNFLWDTAGSLPLLLDDGTVSYIYGPSSSPIAQIAHGSSTTSYLHDDLIGTPRLITDGTGAVTATIRFDAYGNPLSHDGSGSTAIGYSGNWTDPDTGLVYLRARDYDPATGQFLTVDPAVDSTRQPYAYVANNPLLWTDPTGLAQDAGTTIDQVLGFFIPTYSVISSSVKNVINHVNAGASVSDALVMTLDPAFGAIHGYYYEVQDSINGCSGEQIFMDAAEAVIGVAGTAAIATGGAGIASGPSGAAAETGGSASFIVKPNGETLIVPDGAIGPAPVTNGKGFQYAGGAGGNGLHPSASSVRVMDPDLSEPFPKPNGYASYSNAGGQAIDPFTGETLRRSDDYWHWLFSK